MKNDDGQLPTPPEIAGEKFLANWGNHGRETGVHAAIMFVDLVGSTEFKRPLDPLPGLAKSVLHNRIVERAGVSWGVLQYPGGYLSPSNVTTCLHHNTLCLPSFLWPRQLSP